MLTAHIKIMARVEIFGMHLLCTIILDQNGCVFIKYVLLDIGDIAKRNIVVK